MDMEKNAEKGVQLCKKAAEMGADICLFYEGWNVNYDLNSVKEIIETNSDSQMEQLEKQCDTFLETFKELAKEHDMVIALPCILFRHGVVENNVKVIGRDGQVKISYNKVHTCEFYHEGLMLPGEEFFVEEIDTKKGKIKVGVMTCFDREFPESARILMLKGAELILVPNNSRMEQNRIQQLNTRAMENMLAIAMCNAPGADMGHSVAFDGISYKANEDGRDMKTVEAGEYEDIYIANFDIDKLRDFRKKEVWGNAYRNPTLYGQLVDENVAEEFIRVRRRQNCKR